MIAELPSVHLAEQEELHFLRNLLNSSLDVICCIDAEGHFTYVSAASKKLWGYEPEELVGIKYLDLVHPEDHTKTMAIADAILSGQNITSFENRYIRKDGTALPVMWSATWNEEEGLIYCTAKDATEKKKLEAKLLRNKKMFKAFMNNSPIVGWVADEHCRMQYMNDLYLKTYGFTEADFGKNIYDMFPKKMAVDFHWNNLRVLKEGKAIEVTENAPEVKGKQQTLKIFKFPIEIDGERMVAGWAVDISEQMQLKDDLRKSIERYDYVSEATSDAIFEWDLGTNTVYRGPGFVRIFGRSLGKNPFPENIVPKDRQRISAVIQKALDDPDEDRYKIEYRYLHENGALKYLLARAFIIRKNGKAVKVIGSVQDITEQKKLHEQLIEQERTAKRKIVKSIIETQEKERRLLSVELHDNVNQMLTSCKLMMEVAREGGESAWSLIDKTYQSLSQVISEIRKISHELNPAALQDVGLTESIQQMANNINLTGKMQLNFSQKGCYNKNCLSDNDRIAVFRIVQEQVSNLVKHSKATEASIQLIKEGSQITIIVEDNGIGIKYNTIKKGLGFRNIKNRIDYYLGTFDVQSEPGNGTRVEIKLNIDANANEGLSF